MTLLSLLFIVLFFFCFSSMTKMFRMILKLFIFDTKIYSRIQTCLLKCTRTERTTSYLIMYESIKKVVSCTWPSSSVCTHGHVGALPRTPWHASPCTWNCLMTHPATHCWSRRRGCRQATSTWCCMPTQNKWTQMGFPALKKQEPWKLFIHNWCCKYPSSSPLCCTAGIACTSPALSCPEPWFRRLKSRKLLHQQSSFLCLIDCTTSLHTLRTLPNRRAHSTRWAHLGKTKFAEFWP